MEYSQAIAVSLHRTIKQHTFLKHNLWYCYFNVLTSQGPQKMYGKPTFTGLHNFHELLKDNATYVPTKITNGNYGLIPLIIRLIDCENLYGHKWIPPNDSGAPPILETITLTVNKKNIIHINHNNVNQYNLMINTEATLKQQIVSSIDTNYLMGLRNDNNVFSGVLAWIMMDDLYTNHGNI